MIHSSCGRAVRKVLVAAGILMGGMLLAFQQNVSADSGVKPKGNAGEGRNVFNGKGVCYYCHGINGYRDKLPRLSGDTAALIAQLTLPTSRFAKLQELETQD